MERHEKGHVRGDGFAEGHAQGPPGHHYQGPPFPAIDDRGGDYLLTPAYAPGHGHAARRTYAADDCVGLTTADGRAVARIDKGRYVIIDGGPDRRVALFSDDPQAP